MTRQLPENDARPDEPDNQSDQGGPDSGGQSGDTQGLSPTQGRTTRPGS